MSDQHDPLAEQLADMGRAAVPPPDPAFMDRLESGLRVEHAGSRRRVVSTLWTRVLVGAAAAALAILGIVGLTSRPTQDPGVSVSVFDEPEVAETPTAEEDVAGADPTATSTPSAVTPTPASAVVVAPTATSDANPATTPNPEPATSPTAQSTPAATATPAPTATPVPAETPAPTATPEPTEPPEPTATPEATATPTPSPTVLAATAVPVPTETPTETPTPAPTSTPVAPPVAATCDVRIQGDALGVVCEWQLLTEIDLTGYQLMRTRNGEAREVVATVGAQETTAVDRAVRPGDSIVYRVLALTGDVVRSESAAIPIEVPSG